MLPNRSQRRLLWLWLKLRRQVRNELKPENAVHWVELGMFVLSIGLMVYEFLNFFWWLGHICGAR